MYFKIFVYVTFIWRNNPKSSDMVNKNSLAVKKVQGQSEATMVVSDQKL